VKHWTTINEPEIQAVSLSVYNLGHWSTENCRTTKICTEVYNVLHNLLISHAVASKLYKSKFQVRHFLEIVFTYIDLTTKFSKINKIDINKLSTLIKLVYKIRRILKEK